MEDTYLFANGIRVRQSHLLPHHIERYAAGLNLHEPVEEAWVTSIVKAIPPGPCIFVDIGAAIGYYCLLVAKDRPDATLHAFEPNLDHHPRILDNAALNNAPAITLHAEAVGERPGQGVLAGSGFGGYLARAAGAQGRPVTTTTIDAIAAALGTIHLMKIDIQGGEVPALLGADAALRAKSIRNLVVGTHHDDIHQRCLEILHARGYRFPFQSRYVDHQPDGTIVAQAT